MSTDESLYAFLESFLKFRCRWYDFPYHGVQGIVAGVIVDEFELCRRVFMVLYRLYVTIEPIFIACAFIIALICLFGSVSNDHFLLV